MANLYLCNPTRNKECKKTFCYFTGDGECRCTTYPERALLVNGKPVVFGGAERTANNGPI